MPAGRPKKEFSEKDIEQIKVLARCHCPDSEIAAFVQCGERTLKRHFASILKEEREAGKANIRRTQYELAMNGDKTMLIWLGKQLLGQSEKIEQGDMPSKQPAKVEIIWNVAPAIQGKEIQYDCPPTGLPATLPTQSDS